MYIRKATEDDLPSILNIYENARIFMKQNGNPTQWGLGYPDKNLISRDISTGVFYVCEEGKTVTGAFAFIIGPEPSYQQIQGGAWSGTEPYGTIHRLASDGKTKGIAKACFEFCHSQCRYLRIDTHKDNLPMQAAIKKYGFTECGIIHVADGSERIAFDHQS